MNTDRRYLALITGSQDPGKELSVSFLGLWNHVPRSAARGDLNSQAIPPIFHLGPIHTPHKYHQQGPQTPAMPKGVDSPRL